MLASGLATTCGSRLIQLVGQALRDAAQDGKADHDDVLEEDQRARIDLWICQEGCMTIDPSCRMLRRLTPRIRHITNPVTRSLQAVLPQEC